MKPIISLVLATDGVCNIACKTCPTGRRDSNVEANRMSFDVFRRILDKAQNEAHVLSCCMYYFNEPMLHPEMIRMLAELGDRKLYRYVSTNLSFAPDSIQMKRVLEMLELGVENIIISVSGWNQDTYQRSHKNGRIDWVKANMAEIALRRKPETFIRLSWHIYEYNKNERYLMEAYCKNLHFKFTPYGTGVLPLERVLARWQDGLTDSAEEDIMVKLPEAKKLCFERRHWNCQMQDQVFVVDWAGNVYNCGDMNSPANWRGNFFKDGTVSEFLVRRQKDSTCLKCKSMGGHIYAAQEYTTPLFNPKRHVDMIYRKLHLQKLLQKFSYTLWRRLLEGYYNRPQKKEV